MSFYEDFVADGLLCMNCGSDIDGKEPGYPRSCGCENDKEENGNE